MFNKHVYTCPDVIHLRNRQKKINLANLAVVVVATVGLTAWGKMIEWQEERDLKKNAPLTTD